MRNDRPTSRGGSHRRSRRPIRRLRYESLEPRGLLNGSPILAEIILSSDFLNEGDSLTVIGSFTDPDLGLPGEAFRVEIDWGTGERSLADVDQALGTFMATHQYRDDGVFGFPILVAVTDVDGNRHSSDQAPDLARSVMVFDLRPVLMDVAFSSTDLINHQPVALRARVRDLDPIFQASVDWGDGSAPAQAFVVERSGDISVLESEPHEYTMSGEYTVTISVNDGQGGFNSFIFSHKPIVRSLGEVYSYEIDWGDGSPTAHGVPATNGKDEQGNLRASFASEHQYLDAGDYTIDITIRDNVGHFLSRFAAASVPQGGGIARLDMPITILFPPTDFIRPGTAELNTVPGALALSIQSFPGQEPLPTRNQPLPQPQSSPVFVKGRFTSETRIGNQFPVAGTQGSIRATELLGLIDDSRLVRAVSTVDSFGGGSKRFEDDKESKNDDDTNQSEGDSPREGDSAVRQTLFEQFGLGQQQVSDDDKKAGEPKPDDNSRANRSSEKELADERKISDSGQVGVASGQSTDSDGGSPDDNGDPDAARIQQVQTDAEASSVLRPDGNR